MLTPVVSRWVCLRTNQVFAPLTSGVDVGGYIRISRIFFLSFSASSDSSAIVRLSFSTTDLDVGERRRPMLLLEVEILTRMRVLGL